MAGRGCILTADDYWGAKGQKAVATVAVTLGFLILGLSCSDYFLCGSCPRLFIEKIKIKIPILDLISGVLENLTGFPPIFHGPFFRQVIAPATFRGPLLGVWLPTTQMELLWFLRKLTRQSHRISREQYHTSF